MMNSVSSVPAPIAFPSNLAAQPIIAFANNVKQVGAVLQTQAQSLVDVANTASRYWQGSAANAFAAKVVKRVAEISQASQTINGVPDLLVQYAETIRWAQSAHGDAMRTYYAAWNQLPQSEPVLHKCVAIQREVIDTANSAAQKVADALNTVRNQFLYLSIGWPAPGASLLNARPPGLYPAGPIMSATPRANQPVPNSGASINDLLQFMDKAVDLTEVVGESFHAGGVLRQREMQTMFETHGRNGGKPFIRNGSPVLAWKPGANLTASQGTLAQATARLNVLSGRIDALKVGLKVVKIGGPILDFGAQISEDWNKDLTRLQRTTRAGTSAVVSGASIWAGVKLGVAGGAAAGVWFGGVGAVPGAIIGGIVGGIGGIIAGDLIKEQVFEHGPREVFGGK